MQGTLWMMNSDGNWAQMMSLTEVPEFVPTEEENSNKILCDFSKPITVTGTIKSFHMSTRAHKLLMGWTAKGPIRRRALIKAQHRHGR